MYMIINRLVLFAFFLSSIALEATQPELLQTKDISKVMDKILEQHVDKKEITNAIIKHSFKIYIDQFDPDRLYLLEQEVSPFLQMSDADINHTLEQYKNNQFPVYQRLNDVIQKAIYRARELRVALEGGNSSQLFQKSLSLSSDGHEEWRDPDLKRPFARNETELSERIKQAIIQFIASERQRYGEAFISKRTVQTVKVFELEARNHENQYLFLNDKDQPMNASQAQNAFTLHILKALANGLDAHTSVLSPDEANDMRMRLEKEVQGIGVELQVEKNGNFVVSQLVEGGPAVKSGLIKLKDQLLEIDGTSVRSKSLKEVMEMIRGKVDTPVSLTLKRQVEENGSQVDKVINVKLVRDQIPINIDRAQSSFEKIDGGIIGKIKLDSFYQGDNGVTSENDIRDAINKLKKQGNLKGLILDLSENSGGFLNQAVKVAGLFITNGVVVISKYFNGEEHIFRDMDGKRAYDGPLIILTSKATASAAEIVAQSLQDYGVAIIVGDEHTYGKGTIQSQTVTESHDNTYFKVTVGTYYTVSGKTPQINGVKADIVVPSQFMHEKLGEKYLDYPLKEGSIPPAYDDNLKDVASNLKSWYLHFYVPTIQHQRADWTKILPTLQKNSASRIANNKEYQAFIKGEAAKFESSANPNEDLQMVEAVNILKDMIRIQAESQPEDK